MSGRLVDFLAGAVYERKELNWFNAILAHDPTAGQKGTSENLPLHLAVAALLAAYPDAAREKDRHGVLPLHLATKCKAPPEVVAALLAAYPEAAREKDEKEKLPLHLSAESMAPPKVAAALLVAYPEAAREKEKWGRLPLHFAAENKAPLEVVAALLAAYPEAARKKDSEGKLPLHYASDKKAPLEVVAALLSAYPEAASEKDKKEKLPLHYAAAEEASPEVVGALLSAYPDAIREKGSYHGRLPLHFAAETNISHEAFALLVKAYPEAAGEKDAQGMLPLQLAASCKASLEIVAALIAAYPEAATEKDSSGNNCLHMATKNSAPFEVVAALLAAYPEAAKKKGSNYDGLPLHLAAENKAPFEVVAALLEAYPEAARKKDKMGKLPLHFATENKASLEVVAALLAIYPEAAREKEQFYMLPLHFAVKKMEASPEVVAALLAAYPEAAREKEQLGRLPLHYAAEMEAPLGVVAALLVAYPEAAREEDKERRLPLHWAAEKKAPLEVVAALLVLFPEAARKRDRQGKLPLQLAAICKASLKVVLAILAAYPEAAREKVDNGRYPLHYATEHAFPLEVVAALLVAYPEAAREKDIGGKLPLHYALEKNAPLEVLLPLLLLDLPLLLDADVSPAPNHAHSWTYFIDATKSDPGKSKAIVEAIFSHFNNSQAHCLALAHSKDELGREAILIAHAEVQQLMYSYIYFCGRYELQAGPPVHRSATAVVLAATDHGLPDKPRVALKLMRSAAQHRQEVEVRQSRALDGRFVVGLLPGPASELLTQQVQGLRMHDGRSLAAYPHCVVMPLADRSLADIASKERPDLHYVQLMMREVAEALQHCHERGVTHGDLKLLNALRVGAAIKLIDMDASALLGRDFACAKFSSGVLPPEMFYELKGKEEERRHAAYFQTAPGAEGAGAGDGIGEDSVEWAKIRPVGGVVVRTFLPAKLPPSRGNAAAVAGGGSQGANDNCSSDDTADGGLPYALVPASTAADVWAFGALLFHMVAGEPLLPVNRDDDLVDAEGLRQALGWTDEQLRRKVGNAPVPGDALQARLVKDLLKLVLRPEASQRVSLRSVLAHPFFTGLVPPRLSAEADVQWDVFISYRVDSDAALAAEMHARLSARGLRVWFDVKCLLPGVSWEAGFCNGLIQSRCIVPILSRAANKARFEALHEGSACDNVLLELRLAGELHRRGMIQRVFPLLVGDLDAAGHYGDYFRQGCHPSPASSCCVAAVEANLLSFLEGQGLGLPLKAAPSVMDVLGDITINQGGKVIGGAGLGGILEGLADTVRDMVLGLAAAPATAANARDDIDALRGQLEQEMEEKEEGGRRCAALEAVLRAHNLPSPP